MFADPSCSLPYAHLQDLFYSADPRSVEAMLRQCLPEILDRRPERQSQRICALAKLAMKTGNRRAVCTILDHGRCSAMSPASMHKLRQAAAKYGMEEPMMQMCGSIYGHMYGRMRGHMYGHGRDYGLDKALDLGWRVGRSIDSGWQVGRSIGAGLRALDPFRFGSSSTAFLPPSSFSPNELPIDIFRTMTRSEAAGFGFNGECAALTFDHFAFPGARVAVVKALSPECFQSLSPDCFAGMSRKMVRAIRHWPLVRAKQIAAVSPSAIRGLNWDLLGWGPVEQFEGHQHRHPCSGVTPDQELAIQPVWHKWQKYQARCLGGPPLRSSYFGRRFTGGLFYFLIILFAVLLLIAAFA